MESYLPFACQDGSSGTGGRVTSRAPDPPPTPSSPLCSAKVVQEDEGQQGRPRREGKAEGGETWERSRGVDGAESGVAGGGGKEVGSC